MKCRNCSQEIKYEQTYFKLVGQPYIRWHHVCYIYLKPMEIRNQAGHPFPSVTMHNDKQDGTSAIGMKLWRCEWNGGERMIMVDIAAATEEDARYMFNNRYDFDPDIITEIKE